MAGTDARRIEHQIRSLPGVVACQFTAANALVLVGPDGDPSAVQAAVARLLDDAASGLSLSVLSAPRPVAAVTSLAHRRRRRAAFAMAGSAAALSASMAAATTMVVLGGVDVPDATRPAGRTETAAPITLLTDPPLAEQLVPRAPRTLTDKLIDAVEVGAPASPASPAAPAAPQAVLIEVPLPPALTGLEKSARTAKAAPRPAAAPPADATPPALIPQPDLAPPPVPEVVVASSAPQGDDGPPHGVARRVRKGNSRGPADQASPVATAEGAKDRKR